jgi:mannose-6-phosphate isomerase
MSIEPVLQLKCSCNKYGWGKKGRASLAARLCEKTPGWDNDGPKTDFRIDKNTHYAEM